MTSPTSTAAVWSWHHPKTNNLSCSSQQNLIYIIDNIHTIRYIHLYISFQQLQGSFQHGVQLYGIPAPRSCWCCTWTVEHRTHWAAVWGGGLRTGTRHKLGIIPSPYQGHYPVKSTWFDLGKCLGDVLKPLGCPKKS